MPVGGQIYNITFVGGDKKQSHNYFQLSNAPVIVGSNRYNYS